MKNEENKQTKDGRLKVDGGSIEAKQKIIEEFKKKFCTTEWLDGGLGESTYLNEEVDLERLFSFLSQALDSYGDLVSKEYKDICQSCRGKGYSSYFAPGTAVSTDFPEGKPIERYQIKAPEETIVYCKCERGKQLEKTIDSYGKICEKKVLDRLSEEINIEHPDYGNQTMRGRGWIDAIEFTLEQLDKLKSETKK